MTGWKKLTDDDGDEVWVNVGRAIWIQRYDDYTRIAFAGSDDDVIDVVQMPEEVLA